MNERQKNGGTVFVRNDAEINVPFLVGQLNLIIHTLIFQQRRDSQCSGLPGGLDFPASAADSRPHSRDAEEEPLGHLLGIGEDIENLRRCAIDADGLDHVVTRQFRRWGAIR